MNTRPLPLPLADTVVAERGDAARNRTRLLDAAALLVTELGAEAVTMDAIAARAGVGKGTVFRRFGSRTGLLRALLDHSEREFQHGFLHGPPPLGPGAPPAERLVAFGRARIALVEVQGELLRAADAANSRYDNPAHRVSLLHVTALLREAEITADPHLLASSLVASLDATLLMHQWRELGHSLERLADNWTELAHRVLTGRSAPEPSTDAVP